MKRLQHVLIWSLLMGVATPGWSFVRSSPSGFPVSWNSTCLVLYLSSSGSEDISINVLEAAISDSMEPWNTLACSGVGLIYDGTISGDFVGFSNEGPNHNLIVFQDDLGDWVYQPDILALTTLTFCSAQGGLCKFQGQILDADIEFNGREEPFSASEGSVMDHHDFVNTLTHELGHFIGLDHSLDPESTMYFSAPMEEISKRSLNADDEAGFCAIYAACSGDEECTACRDSEGAQPPELPAEEELAGCNCGVAESILGHTGGQALFWLALFYCVAPRRSRR